MSQSNDESKSINQLMSNQLINWWVNQSLMSQSNNDKWLMSQWLMSQMIDESIVNDWWVNQLTSQSNESINESIDSSLLLPNNALLPSRKWSIKLSQSIDESIINDHRTQSMSNTVNESVSQSNESVNSYCHSEKVHQSMSQSHTLNGVVHIAFTIW